MDIDLQKLYVSVGEAVPRRGFIAVCGKAVATAGVLLAGLGLSPGPAHAACTDCGGCGSAPCGATEAGCCPGCIALDGIWCGGSATAWGGNCNVGGCTSGWYWYCCDNAGQKYICQDCCCTKNNCTTRGAVSGQCPFGPMELTQRRQLANPPR